MGSASLLTQTISMPCPENTVPTSPDGVDPDLTGLAEHDVEDFRARAARILDRHEILSAGGDEAGPPRRATRSARRGTSAVRADRGDRSQGSRRELVTLVAPARDQRPQIRLAAALT
jgi:hypothetical protein